MEPLTNNIRIKLSALWTSMMFLYVYADFLSLYRPGQIDEMRNGMMGPFEVSGTGLLTASVLMIIPALMIFLSQILKPTVNRWANIVVGIVYTLVNISNLIGETWAYYFLFGIVEILITLFIVCLAWKWKSTQGK